MHLPLKPLADSPGEHDLGWVAQERGDRQLHLIDEQGVVDRRETWQQRRQHAQFILDIFLKIAREPVMHAVNEQGSA